MVKEMVLEKEMELEKVLELVTDLIEVSHYCVSNIIVL